MATIMEVTVQSTFKNQQCLNVFNYLFNGSGSDPGGLSDALLNGLGYPLWDDTLETYPAGSVAAAYRAISHQEVTFEIITVRNVYSRFDFTEYLFPFAGESAIGASGGESASPALAYGFRSSKVASDIKRGARRLVGVSETNMGSGGVFTPTALIALNSVATAFSAELPAFLNEFQPCICKKEKVAVLNPDGTPTGRFKYEYYEDPEVQVDNTGAPVTWGAVNTVRTQTSRQYGRGR